MTTQTKTRHTVNKVSNDPVGDYLTRIRNAALSLKQELNIPFSRVKLELTELLQREGYIDHFSVINEDDAARKSIAIRLKFNAGKPVVQGLKRISNPGLRKYSKSKAAPRVYSGLGISVLTTNKGLKTDREARKENVGGEILCVVW